MADITITIPAASLARTLDAIAARNGYNAATHGTKAQFARAWIIRTVRAEVRGWEVAQARAAAKKAAETSSDGVVIT